MGVKTTGGLAVLAPNQTNLSSRIIMARSELLCYWPRYQETVSNKINSSGDKGRDIKHRQLVVCKLWVRIRTQKRLVTCRSLVLFSPSGQETGRGDDSCNSAWQANLLIGVLGFLRLELPSPLLFLWCVALRIVQSVYWQYEENPRNAKNPNNLHHFWTFSTSYSSNQHS